MISPYFLIRTDLLSKDETIFQQPFSDDRVDYLSVAKHKRTLLSLAFERLEQQGKSLGDFTHFCTRQKAWLDDFAAYMAIKEHFHMRSWDQWPQCFAGPALGCPG